MQPVQKSAGDGLVSDSTSQIGSPSGPSVLTGPSTSVPMRAGLLPVAELVRLYMTQYAGRDTTRVQRLTWWTVRLGPLAMQDVTDDHIYAALEELTHQRATYYAGKDAAGHAIHKAKRKPIAPATINRYAASIAAVFTWAIKRRVAPKGWVHPCRAIERRTENNEKTRFLSDEERARLLEACKMSRWPRLYLLVLTALTTGARKGELLGLRWSDIDWSHSVAHVGRSKNGDPKSLPLVPSVIAELRRFEGGPSSLVFSSRLNAQKPCSFEPRWAEALQIARIRAFRFHDLRHSCASMLAQNGATLLEIGDLLGHRQLQVTKRYSHLATGHKAAMVNRILGNIR